MKKIALLLCILLSCTAYSYQQTKFHLNKIATTQDKPEDFSGTWAGHCDGEHMTFTFLQSDRHITIENKERFGTLKFRINKLITKNVVSPGSIDFKIMQAYLHGNILSLMLNGTSYESGQEYGTLINLSYLFEKQGNTMIFTNVNPCTLTKVN